MSGLFRRLSSRRSEDPEGAPAEPGAADAPATAPAEPGGHESLLVDPAAQTRVLREGEGAAAAPQPGPEPPAEPPAPEPAAETPADPATTVHPVVRLQAAPHPEPPYAAPPAVEGPAFPVSDLPAGIDPDELAASPITSARRGRLRRRVSFLRAAREVLMRDLGGFVYELHRTAGDIEHEAHRRLREVKLARLSRLDAELHELELRLDDVRRHVVVREPGVGGECPNCSELFGSDAHYCAHCGLPLTESARRAVAREATAPEPVAAEPSAVPDQPTEEYSTLGHEFEWPTRAAAADPEEQPTSVIPGEGASETPAGEAPGTGDDAAAETASGEPAAASEDAAAGGATPAAGDYAPPAGGEPEAASDTATGSENEAAERVENPVAERDDGAAGDDAPVAERDDSASGDGEGDETAAVERGDAAGDETAAAARDDAAGGETAVAERGDSVEPADGDAARGEAAGGEPGAPGDGGAWHDSPGDAYSPVERRR